MFVFRKVDIATIQYCNICVDDNESKLAPPGVRNVRISYVPTVTDTIPDVHPRNSTS